MDLTDSIALRLAFHRPRMNLDGSITQKIATCSLVSSEGFVALCGLFLAHFLIELGRLFVTKLVINQLVTRIIAHDLNTYNLLNTKKVVVA